jgi:hypothetical protein
MSGGSSDGFTIAIAHNDKSTAKVIVDCIREVRPPFSPESTVGFLPLDEKLRHPQNRRRPLCRRMDKRTVQETRYNLSTMRVLKSDFVRERKNSTSATYRPVYDMNK